MQRKEIESVFHNVSAVLSPKQKAIFVMREMDDMASADKLLVSGYHFPFPGLGYIEKAGSGYRLIPAAWNPVI